MAPRHPNIATETSKGLFGDQNALMALAKLRGEEIVTASGDSQWWSAQLPNWESSRASSQLVSGSCGDRSCPSRGFGEPLWLTDLGAAVLPRAVPRCPLRRLCRVCGAPPWLFSPQVGTPGGAVPPAGPHHRHHPQ